MAGRVENWIPGAIGIQFEVRGCPRARTHILILISELGGKLRAWKRDRFLFRVFTPKLSFSRHWCVQSLSSASFFSNTGNALVNSKGYGTSESVTRLYSRARVLVGRRRPEEKFICGITRNVTFHLLRKGNGETGVIYGASLASLDSSASRTLRSICASHILPRAQFRASDKWLGAGRN